MLPTLQEALASSGVRFVDSIHVTADEAESLLGNLFRQSQLPEFPGADFYSVAYGELCAYAGPELQNRLLAVWTREVPDSGPVSRSFLGGRWQAQR